MVLLEGYTETFRGLVTDNNHAPEELVARWYSGDEPLCEVMLTSGIELTVLTELSESQAHMNAATINVPYRILPPAKSKRHTVIQYTASSREKYRILRPIR